MIKADVIKLYDTLLSIPGMNESIKISFQASRKNILILSRVIERGISGTGVSEKSQVFFEIVSKEVLKEISELALLMLEKSGLREMNENLEHL